jgi:hypothetical protein
VRVRSQQVASRHNLNHFRYYQPCNSAESLATSESSSGGSAKLVTPKFLLDTALTAFAQLIALRFDAQRAIVSLIDQEHEYFLAESTSTLSLLDTKSYAQNYFLSKSGAKVPRDASLGEHTLHLPPNQTAGAFPASFVPDLRLDWKLSQLECVTGAPHLRFYCGVPITNVKGVNIGSVYVVDDTARAEVSFEQLQFLKMMAATVMDHLENIRIREEVTRVTTMSQGLHAFIEGDGTMHGDWKRLRKYNLPAGAGIGYSWKSNESSDSKRPHSPIEAAPSSGFNRSFNSGR